MTVSAAESDADTVTTVTISGLGRATLSADHDNGDGSWTLQQSDLVGLTLQRHRSGDGQTGGADAAIHLGLASSKRMVRHRCSTAYEIRINGRPKLGVPYRGQPLKVTEQEQSWLFEVGPRSFPYL